MQLNIQTTRLTLLPFTMDICIESLSNVFGTIAGMGIYPGSGWPDPETLDTLPRIIKNLVKVNQPSGFESWMIIEKNTNLLIGDIGFKGIPNENGEVDLGYGIITKERKKGFALEAATGILKWAFQQQEVRSITANCLTDNLGSQKILSLLNFSIIKMDDEMIYWRLLKD
ncbi:GNAT family N-acetyltransferase [Pedobacter sp. AW31-3R]|uniref:GNAT family N-acetyltransferase n=1 Tax=Pedobacter sp. AW31-3R TaxID=3445781 RepID=UPI003FA1434C